MTYQVLARKWRPQDFSSIIGQEPIVTALRNGLRENRIAQAYLFSGIRGVGKTTAARVLSKALNCEGGENPGQPADNPCNECIPCTDIATGKDLDVLEVDAATYSKVEQVRELAENLRYAPARDRYKVVVLDEVHRLSRQAFDALLKIVEEPPPHLIFVFATTESEAVPATVLSRCQEFHFRRVPSLVMVAYLRQISEAEDITVDDKALRLIARAGEGSVRDSVALLDQLATFGNNKISDQEAARLLGGLDTAIFHRLMTAILTRQSQVVAEIVREVEVNGWDPHNVYGQFLTYSKDGLLLAMGGGPEASDLPSEETQALKTLLAPHSYRSILQLTQHLLNSEQTVRRSEFSLVALNLAWLRAAELPDLTRIEHILSGQTDIPRPKILDTSSLPVPTGPELDAAPSKKRTRTPDQDRPKPNRPTDSQAPPQTKPTRVFRELIAEQRQPLAALLESADLSFRANQLEIRPQPGDTLLKAALGRKNNADLVSELTRKLWSPDAAWTITDAKPDLVKPTKDRSSSNTQKNDLKDDPTVNVVLDIFGGKIQSVK